MDLLQKNVKLIVAEEMFRGQMALETRFASGVSDGVGVSQRVERFIQVSTARFAKGVNIALVNQSALIDHHDSVRHGFHFLKNMRTQENGFGLSESPHGVTHAPDLIRVETRGWLVKNQNVGVMQQCLAHAHTLFETLGEFADGFVDDRGQIADVDRSIDMVAFL